MEMGQEKWCSLLGELLPYTRRLRAKVGMMIVGWKPLPRTQHLALWPALVIWGGRPLVP
jgi:hypothetical protein